MLYAKIRDMHEISVFAPYCVRLLKHMHSAPRTDMTKKLNWDILKMGLLLCTNIISRHARHPTAPISVIAWHNVAAPLVAGTWSQSICTRAKECQPLVQCEQRGARR